MRYVSKKRKCKCYETGIVLLFILNINISDQEASTLKLSKIILETPVTNQCHKLFLPKKE